MNNNEAKFILQAYRPGGEDASDPQFAEALQQVQRDPELANWFAQERSLDSAIIRKLKESPIPSHLKATILAGRKIIQPVHSWKRQAAWAVAASLVLLLSLVALWTRTGREPGLADYRGAMARMLSSKEYTLDLTTADVRQIQQWLGTHNGHGDFVLPAGLSGFPGHGCLVLNWQGKRVSMICLRTQSNGIVHLFVIDRLDLRGAPPPGTRQFAAAGEWMTASWTQDDKTYLLTGRADRTALEKML